jgi:hypothetical protein
MRNLLLATAITALVLVGCSKKDDAEAKADGNKEVVVTAPPVAGGAAQPMPEIAVPDRISNLMATPLPSQSAAGPDIKLDTRTPEAFVSSLQAIERAATKEKVDLLRGALTVLQLQTQEKIAKIAAGRSTPPQFSDTELMQIAFSEINGMTADQVIDHARKIAPTVVQQQG